MLRAFDSILQMTVSANAAAANSDNEAFRYECLCCGEEVRLAAQESKDKATHFRHRSGNNDKECELYLGRHGIIPNSPAIRNKKQDRVEFYYDNLHKAFYISFRFSETEISAYEVNASNIEVREYRTSQPFLSKAINHINFCEDNAETYMLERYATPYYISNTTNDIKREYYVFSKSSPTFFKIQGYDTDYKAKYIKSTSLYTNVKYLIAWPGQNTAQINLCKVPDVQIDEVFEFKTMNNTTVWALVATFSGKNQQLDTLLQSWGYNLSVSEELMLLWPPAFEKDETLHVFSDKVFLFSSFMLQAYGNTNTPSDSMQIVNANITKVDIKDRVRILKKNAEMSIVSSKVFNAPTQLYVQHLTSTKFTVPEEGQFYRFSSLGTEKLFPGQVVFLTNKSSIIEYNGNYISSIITMPETEEISTDEKIQDALSHYWVKIPYDNVPEAHLSETVAKIFTDSNNEKQINKAVFDIIKEEKI